MKLRWFGRRDPDLRDEILEHIEIETQENIERGLSPAEARAAAMRKFGNAGVARESVREERPMFRLEIFFQDLRYALRMLRRNALLAAAVVLTLTIGIGLNASVFTVMNALLFRPRVQNDPASFVTIYVQHTNTNKTLRPGSTASIQEYNAFRAASTLSGLAATLRVGTTFGPENSTTARATLVSCNFFSIYGLDRALMGRLFLPEECATPGSAPVAVVTETLWRFHLGADPAAIGKTIYIGGYPYTLVGVAPANFSDALTDGTSFWIPFTMQAQFGGANLFQQSATPWLSLNGRLSPGRTRTEAQTELNGLAARQDALVLGHKTIVIATDGSILSAPGIGSRAFLITVGVLTPVMMILLLVCANVSTLLLSRATARKREIAIRLALGAGSGRLLRMLLTESLLLSGLSGVISVFLAYRMPAVWASQFLEESSSFSLKPDWRVFIFVAGMTLFAGVLSGIAPAMESLKVDLNSSLKGEAGFFAGARRKWRSQDWLVGTQVALGLVLMVGAAIFIRATIRLAHNDPGYETRHVIASSMSGKAIRATSQEFASQYRTEMQRIAALPGVQSVGYASNVAGAGPQVQVSLPGIGAASTHGSFFNDVSPSYFQTLGIPILRGRTFTESEANSVPPAPVAVVSQKFVQALWPVDDPLGKQFQDEQGRAFEVIGVARDTKPGALFDADLQFYRVVPPGGQEDLLVRFTGDARPVQDAVRAIVYEESHGYMANPQTVQTLIDQAGDELWIVTEFALILGGISILLAVIGIYSVVAFGVSQRTRELGVRMALGATRGDIVRYVFSSGVKPIFAGMLAGAALTIGMMVLLAKMFANAPSFVNTHDPIASLVAAVLFLVVAAVAIYGPARRASRLDPVRALRYE
jgi:predicted permease